MGKGILTITCAVWNIVAGYLAFLWAAFTHGDSTSRYFVQAPGALEPVISAWIYLIIFSYLFTAGFLIIGGIVQMTGSARMLFVQMGHWVGLIYWVAILALLVCIYVLARHTITVQLFLIGLVGTVPTLLSIISLHRRQRLDS